MTKIVNVLTVIWIALLVASCFPTIPYCAGRFNVIDRWGDGDVVHVELSITWILSLAGVSIAVMAVALDFLWGLLLGRTTEQWDNDRHTELRDHLLSLEQRHLLAIVYSRGAVEIDARRVAIFGFHRWQEPTITAMCNHGLLELVGAGSSLRLKGNQAATFCRWLMANDAVFNGTVHQLSQ